MFTVGTTNEAVRVKWIEETLKKIPEGLTILDAGAGESQFKKFCSHLKYIAQDFDICSFFFSCWSALVDFHQPVQLYSYF